MKLNPIAFAIATLAAGTAAQAAIGLPAAQTIVNDAVANGRVVYLSGASATQSGLQGISTSLCQAGTAYRFANTTASSRDFEAVACNIAKAAGTWGAGSSVIIVDRVKGGSVWGVDPVARATAIENLLVTDASCSGSVGTATTPFTCGTTSVVSDAGISDIDPALFKGPINTEGEIPAPSLTPAELAEFDAPGFRGPIYALGFGYAFTNNLPDFYLTHADVRGILSGNVYTWDGVDPSLPHEDIVVCRRVPGSGTQSVYNLYNNNFPCDPNNFLPPVDRDTSGNYDDITNTYSIPASAGDGSGYAVIENSTSGDVRNCLNAAISGGTYLTKDRDGAPVTVNFNGNSRKAIGLLSLDSMGSSKTSTSTWSFRSIDGAGKIHCDTACTTAVAPVTVGTGTFPTEANVENGTWDLQGHISMNIPKRTTGNKRALLDNFLAAARDPAILDSIAALDHVAAAVQVSGYTGTGVQKAKYLNNNQCGPYYKVQ